VVICLERGADLHTAQLMPPPLTVSCFSKIQISFTFLVLAHLGSFGQRAVKRVCVCVCVIGKIITPVHYLLFCGGHCSRVHCCLQPTSMRAIRARYNPYLQTRHRIEQVTSGSRDFMLWLIYCAIIGNNSALFRSGVVVNSSAVNRPNLIVSYALRSQVVDAHCVCSLSISLVCYNLDKHRLLLNIFLDCRAFSEQFITS